MDTSTKNAPSAKQKKEQAQTQVSTGSNIALLAVSPRQGRQQDRRTLGLRPQLFAAAVFNAAPQ